jgi:hypothetical protein
MRASPDDDPPAHPAPVFRDRPGKREEEGDAGEGVKGLHGEGIIHLHAAFVEEGARICYHFRSMKAG